MSIDRDALREVIAKLVAERVREAFQARALAIAERLVGLTDEREARRVLNDEMRRVIVDAGIGVEDDLVAKARLDGAVQHALGELGRLTESLGG